MSKLKRIGLVAAVGSQPSSASPAIDLYRSAEFLAARRRVESSCGSWFILSPRYHLVSPGDWLEPYALNMADLGPDERAAWSERILAELEEKVGSLQGLTFELHASPEFYEHGLLAGLLAAKAKVSIGGEETLEPAKPKVAPVSEPKATKPRPARRRQAAAPPPEPVKVEITAEQRRPLVDEFYGLIEEQAEAIGGFWSLPDCSGDDHWPEHGVVFFVEPGEMREDGETPRIVRVGTHALTPTSKTRLWDRLRSDRGALGGANPGSGNHRASALRRYVGRALMAREGFPEAAATWGGTGKISAQAKQDELALEIAVSRHIAEMDFVWMAVPRLEDRLAIESGAVSLLSNLNRDPLDPPSADWLGRDAGQTIAGAGLWNVDHAELAPQTEVLELLRRHIEA